MSLPLSRRIARAALLLGAAAAPLIGAGAAHAAVLPQRGTGALTNLEGADFGDAVDSMSHQTTVLVAEAGTDAMKATLPTTDHILGTAGTKGLPAVQKAAGRGVDTAGRFVGGAAESASGSLPGAEALPNAGALPVASALPTTGVVTERLPLKGIPVT
ncbi:MULTISPECIES: ATP-binding protein [unclassified Streptomyces]|uniref:ATP-binding protein n=1 Tax=unclassified Streptomyces TaxID=2593676 RepID=UPI002E291B51|nr:ATP-binding protein [Streptomyces sp. NBC_00223]